MRRWPREQGQTGVMAEQRTVGVGIPHLRAWRVRKLVKQGDLARAGGVSRFTVQRAERLRVEAERRSAPGESTRRCRA
jgi:hypothetical protein